MYSDVPGTKGKINPHNSHKGRLQTPVCVDWSETGQVTIQEGVKMVSPGEER